MTTTIDDDHDLEIQPKNLNRFIAKLYRIINSDEPTVRWVPGGQKFLILDPKKFSKTVLPKYFKHSKFASFVRQLNFYGFHKKRIITSDLVLQKNENDVDHDSHQNALTAVCFQHEFFQENRPKLLLRIQRTTKQAQASAELLSLTKQKQLEDLQEQMREMKKQMDNSKAEFDIKLAAARAEIELDYLHRIRAIEVCYKDLVTMILRYNNSKNKGVVSSSEFPLPPKTEKFRFPSASTTSTTVVPETTSAAFPRPPVAPRSISNSSRGTVTAPPPTTRSNDSGPRSILLGQSYTPRDYLVNQKLEMLSQLVENSTAASSGRTRRTFIAATSSYYKNNNNDHNTSLLVRASLSEVLRRNKQILAHYATGNAAA